MTRETDTKALATLRPGDPKEKLIEAAGQRWMQPHPASAGRIAFLEEDFRFKARLDRDGRVGSISYEYGFDPEAVIEGVRMAMPEDEIVRAAPHVTLGKAIAGGPYRYGRADLPGGGSMVVQVGHGRITRIMLSMPDAVYPGIGEMPLPRPDRSVDVRIVRGLRPRGTPAPEGWCMGLPRGIAPLQWPLSTNTGFPLEHHFTVHVPPAYRTKGTEFVALALFSDAGDESKSAPRVRALMNRVFDGRGLPESTDEDLRPFLDHLRNRHPMEFRSKDILGATFAAIWLTEAEFTGTECEPPFPVLSPANEMSTPPAWLTTGAAQRLFGWQGKEDFNPNYRLHQLAGGKPKGPWEIFLLSATERDDDPNIGKQPVDEFTSSENPDGYVQPYSEAWDKLGIELAYADLHFGGTAFPSQAVPDLTPFYIEFEETLGMINFGGGNGQLDLVTMQIDWAQ